MAVIKNYINYNATAAQPKVVDRTKTKSKVRVKSSTLTYTIAIGLIIILLTIQSTQIFLLKNNIFQLEKEMLVAQESFNSATLEVTTLKSPERIQAIAQELSNLRLPTEDQFVAVHSSKR